MIQSDASDTLLAPVPKKRAIRQDKYAPYFFISPFYILFAIFFLFPTVFALVLGFYKWGALGTPSFFGLRNYDHMFKDPLFIKAFWNTIFYAAASLFVVMPLALLEAMALNAKRLRFKYLWRTLYFAPIVTSTVAISLVFRLLYNTNYGFINQIVLLLGGVPIQWMESQSLTKVAVMGVVIWRWTGLLAIYFLAGLQSIPETLYEAAAIDGATGWQRFFHVTLPLAASGHSVCRHHRVDRLVPDLRRPADPLWWDNPRWSGQQRGQLGAVSLQSGYAAAVIRLCVGGRGVPVCDHLRAFTGSASRISWLFDRLRG